MRLGAENKRELRWMVALLAIAVPLAIYSFRSLHGARAAAPTTQAAGPAAAGQPKASALDLGSGEILDPTLRLDLLHAGQKITYEGGKRNIFRMEELPIERPKADVRTPSPPPPSTPLQPPPLPPINLKFFGFANQLPGEPRKVFLSQGGDIFVAQEGDIIIRRYKVIQINNNFVVVEDMLTSNRQPIPLSPS